MLLISNYLRQIKLITRGDSSRQLEVIKMESKMKNKERVFSVELRSKGDLKAVTLTSDSSNGVLVEGTIGELVQATLAEGIILEVVGRKGILRIDLREDEIRKATDQNQTELNRQ
jgi:hypothetical protein